MAAQFENLSSEYTAAFKSLRAAKNLFVLLILLSLLGQGIGFALVHFGGVIDPLHTPAPEGPAVGEAPVVQGEKTGQATVWENILMWTLPALKFVAFVSALLLMLTVMFAVKVSLTGRLGGVSGLIAAFFWSLILLAMATPWQQIMNVSFASGVTYNLGDLVKHVGRIKASWGAKDVILLDRILFYVRFISFPAIAILVMLTLQLRWGRGTKAMSLPPALTRIVEPQARSSSEGPIQL
ncbi:MAG TPA: hypothetical protein DCX07_14510 [Phycisphaerales bacterium]|nr:hypothetical protein [Phycisphaerales bacterium]